MNPMTLLKLRPLIFSFKDRHPKISKFARAAAQIADVGSIAEVKFTTSGGKTIVTNVRITEEDMELFNAIKGK
ncbi:MAG TPA: hypothetical protein DCG30_05705 [Ruminococcus sp.]|nr:hypothetical protein [Ruminococcus sp.]